MIDENWVVALGLASAGRYMAGSRCHQCMYGWLLLFSHVTLPVELSMEYIYIIIALAVYIGLLSS
jgi:hypothetical protein